MKIYTKVVIDMATGNTLYEESFDYNDELALCGGSGGGSSAGAVSFPSHMSNLHDYWLRGGGSYTSADITGGIAAVMEDASTSANGNPFTGAYSYDPTANLDDVDVRYTDYNKMLKGLDAKNDWQAMFDKAGDGLAASVLSDSEIEAAVTQFETQQRLPFNRAVGRFNAGMADINAVTGSAFVVGNVLLEDELSRIVAKFRADLNVQNHKLKFAFVLQSVDEMARMLLSKVNQEHAATHLYGELNRLKTVLQSEYLAAEVDLNIQDATWDLQIYQYGANLLGSIGGGTAMPGKMGGSSKTQSVVGGALAGGASLAVAGTAIMPGVGTAIGAGIGAILGGVAGAQ